MKPSQAKLTGLRCSHCNRLMRPPAYACLDCGSLALNEETLSGEGEVYSVVTANLPGIGFEDLAPYFLAAVQVEDSLLITARLEVRGDRAPQIGDKVVFVSADDGRYVFELAE